MWINDDFYNELITVLSGFADNKVDFNEERFKPFVSEKYNKLSNLLRDIKEGTKSHIKTNIKIMTSKFSMKNITHLLIITKEYHVMF